MIEADVDPAELGDSFGFVLITLEAPHLRSALAPL